VTRTADTPVGAALGRSGRSGAEEPGVEEVGSERPVDVGTHRPQLDRPQAREDPFEVLEGEGRPARGVTVARMSRSLRLGCRSWQKATIA
jgi:hypothetical protein